MVLSHTVGRFSKLRVLPHRSNTPICTSERANLMPMMRKCVVLSLSPMERRFLEPSRSPVSSIMPASIRRAVILVMAAGVSSSALAICARELMPL